MKLTVETADLAQLVHNHETLIHKETSFKTHIERNRMSIFKWLSYAWIVITQVIIVLFVCGIYNKLNSSFEIIVVSLLILLYLGFRDILTLFCKFLFALDKEFKTIRKLLKEEFSEYEEKENEKTVETSMIKIVIGGVFTFIIFLITAFQLASTLIK
jgi:hypothetical protein